MAVLFKAVGHVYPELRYACSVREADLEAKVPIISSLMKIQFNFGYGILQLT